MTSRQFGNLRQIQVFRDDTCHHGGALQRLSARLQIAAAMIGSPRT
jgi:hypothetical protein